MQALAADCGRRSFRYTELRRDGVAALCVAADCGRRSFRYTYRRLVAVRIGRLRIAAVARFATLSRPTRASRSPLRIAAVARFATLDVGGQLIDRRRCGLRPSLVSLHSCSARRSSRAGCGLRPSLVSLHSGRSAIPASGCCGLRPSLVSLHFRRSEWSNRTLLRIAAVARFATLLAQHDPRAAELRIAAVARFATLVAKIDPLMATLRIAAVARFATLRARPGHRPSAAADCGRRSFRYTAR